MNICHEFSVCQMSFCHEFSVCQIQFLSWISFLKNTFSQIWLNFRIVSFIKSKSSQVLSISLLFRISKNFRKSSSLLSYHEEIFHKSLYYVAFQTSVSKTDRFHSDSTNILLWPVSTCLFKQIQWYNLTLDDYTKRRLWRDKSHLC